MYQHNAASATLILSKRLDMKVRAQIVKAISDKQTQAQLGMSQSQADQVSALNAKIDQMIADSKKINEQEMAYIENTMLDVLKNLEAKGLFNLVVSVNGKNYSLRDIVESIANMPTIVKEKSEDDSSGECVGMRYTFNDGTEAVLPLTVTEDDQFLTQTFAGSFNGIQSSFNVVHRKQPIVVEGQTITDYVFVQQTNMTFDPTAKLKEASSFTAKEVAIDMNGDGNVGNVSTEAPTSAPTVAPLGDGAVI
jgi:hypothetical protein